MENVVVYRGSWMFVLQAVCAVVFIAIAFGAAGAGTFLGFVVCGGLGAFMAWRACTHCRRVEVHSDGTLVAFYFLRPKYVSRLSALRSIDRDEEDGEWTLSLGDRVLRLSPNRSAKWLVHTLVHRKPNVSLTGYELPPL